MGGEQPHGGALEVFTCIQKYLEFGVIIMEVIKTALQILLLSAWQLFVEKSMKITDPSPRLLFLQFSTGSSSPPHQR